MPNVCYMCGQVKKAVDKGVSYLDDYVDWDCLAQIAEGQEYIQKKYRWDPVTRKNSYADGEVFVLLQKQAYAQEEQGETTDCFLVFRRKKTGVTYKKLGLGDSYGTIVWGGALLEVVVKKVMVEKWEVVEGN